MKKAMNRIADNLAAIRDNMARAAVRSGRSASDVRLVAVTKYVSAEVARCLVEAGCHELGESRPQQLWEKTHQLDDLDIRWHFIGHLQRNKINRTLPIVGLLHSIDSIRLWQAVNDWAAGQSVRQQALIEVNVSGDATKHGFLLDEVAAAIEGASQWPHVHLRGLMGMASRQGGPEQARRDFVSLRSLRDRLQSQFGNQTDLAELSMGMSQDYPIAIEEGATIVRVGTALYDGVDS